MDAAHSCVLRLGVSEWAYVDCKRPHTHDVRALALVAAPDRPTLIISGGNDTLLVACSVDRFVKARYILWKGAVLACTLSMIKPVTLLSSACFVMESSAALNASLWLQRPQSSSLLSFLR